MSPSDDTSADPEADPFASFDASVGVGQVRDPYPVFSEMRSECPVHAGLHPERFGMTHTPAAMLFGDDTPYTVFAFDPGHEVLRDHGGFSSSIMEKVNGVIMGRTIIEMDEPDHRRYRGLISRVLTPHAMERWERDIVRPIVTTQVETFAHRGQADLVRDLFFPFPVQVIAGMLGLPNSDLEQFHHKAAELLAIMTDIERGLNASQWLYEYFSGIIAERRGVPHEDIVTLLVEARFDDGHGLTDDEIVAFLRLLLPAGAETTYRSSSNLMFGLLTHPDQLDAVRSDRSLLPQAIEEGLRWEAPITSVMRVAARDVEVAGVAVPAGAPVDVCIGSANHDPDRWDEPDRFDIFREQRPHVAFGFGQHVCLGMHLARMETRVAVEALLDLPNLRLDPAAADVHISGLGFRSPASLPVLFDVP